jgi:hypothetical protein
MQAHYKFSQKNDSVINPIRSEKPIKQYKKREYCNTKKFNLTGFGN